MLTTRQVRALLLMHGLAPNKSLGQNFVVDANTVRKIVRDAAVDRGDVVVEVGPGLGSLTVALRAAGAEVVAVEIDAGLVRALADVVAGDDGVTVIHADALDVDYGALLRGRSALMVANLPYNAATPILMGALHSGAFTRLLLMVQREVGERWTAAVGHPSYGAVSVKVAALAWAEIAAPVSRNAFHPVPNVDSVTVRLVPRAEPAIDDVGGLFRLVEAGFAQRRKRLRNALGAAGHHPAAVEAALQSVGRSAGARAEELDLDSWIDLHHALHRRRGCDFAARA
ncbi:MAG: 16S rRNA (adenine(1518)-N(6)/adenine(1519)-N(6))-dimethyltransferase RsmA [Nitriliruptorales bacterium]|nr:16S rRNA (adenine(1518)-N(6)/adenine(1519)-N(6))-dimethyltransferase RsmA [Nitriliruptorales bacterium]